MAMIRTVVTADVHRDNSVAPAPAEYNVDSGCSSSIDGCSDKSGDADYSPSACVAKDGSGFLGDSKVAPIPRPHRDPASSVSSGSEGEYNPVATTTESPSSSSLPPSMSSSNDSLHVTMATSLLIDKRVTHPGSKHTPVAADKMHLGDKLAHFSVGGENEGSRYETLTEDDSFYGAGLSGRSLNLDSLEREDVDEPEPQGMSTRLVRFNSKIAADVDDNTSEEYNSEESPGGSSDKSSPATSPTKKKNSMGAFERIKKPFSSSSRKKNSWPALAVAAMSFKRSNRTSGGGSGHHTKNTNILMNNVNSENHLRLQTVSCGGSTPNIGSSTTRQPKYNNCVESTTLSSARASSKFSYGAIPLAHPHNFVQNVISGSCSADERAQRLMIAQRREHDRWSYGCVLAPSYDDASVGVTSRHQLTSSSTPPAKHSAPQLPSCSRLTSSEDPGPMTRVAMTTLPNGTIIHGPPSGLLAFGCGKSASCPSLGSLPLGSKFKLLREGTIQVCKINHGRNVLSKLAGSKFLRRWETHTLTLDNDEICSKTPTGFMEGSVRYSQIEDVHIMTSCDSTDKVCLRIFVPDGSLLLQTNHSYSRNQWLHSIQWRRKMLYFRKIFETTSADHPHVVLNKLQVMVEHVKSSILQGDVIYHESFALCELILKQIYTNVWKRQLLDPVIKCMSPLLDDCAPSSGLCMYFSRYCAENPRSRVTSDCLTRVALQILKRNMDFGKFPSMRKFVQDFICALVSQNNGLQKVKSFVAHAHGPASCCPHPRVLPNLVSACLAAIKSCADDSSTDQPGTADLLPDERLKCFVSIFNWMSEFTDWRLSLSSILQPIPFPESILSHTIFIEHMEHLQTGVAADPRCEVHMNVLPMREGREGWFHLFCPGGSCCVDEGDLYAKMLNQLLHCCCKRKKFLQSLSGMLGPLQLLALRETEAALEALCCMLEYEIVESDDLKLQMITALQSTPNGRKQYAQLCDRQIALKSLQQAGGPKKLTLPSRSTDQDLAVLLSSGSFGNLEWLSLAFTNVTSACAEYLIKLPSLKYLNLWSTQFGDHGVILISEHLQRLQVLNLCETAVTDKGLLHITSLKNLRKLNLNSTELSAKTFQLIKGALPALQEIDVRYTEAWCSEDHGSG